MTTDDKLDRGKGASAGLTSKQSRPQGEPKNFAAAASSQWCTAVACILPVEWRPVEYRVHLKPLARSLVWPRLCDAAMHRISPPPPHTHPVGVQLLAGPAAQGPNTCTVDHVRPDGGVQGGHVAGQQEKGRTH